MRLAMSMAFRGLISGIAMVAVLSVAVAQQPSDGPGGTWLTEDATSKIRFEACAAAPCGRIVWLKEPVDAETGQPVTDRNNPDKALQTRPILGLVILSGVKARKPREWTASAYNADDGKTYSVTLKMVGQDKMEIEGCGLGGLVCQDETWTRAD